MTGVPGATCNRKLQRNNRMSLWRIKKTRFAFRKPSAVAVSPFGILAYAALSVNTYMFAYEQAPRQPYICFHSQQSCLIPQSLPSMPESENKRKHCNEVET